MKFFKFDKYEKILLITALVLQLFIFIVWNFIVKDSGGIPMALLEDGKTYFDPAIRLLNEHSFSSNRAPLLPLLWAALYAIVPRVWFLVIAQNILALIGVILVYRFAGRLFSKLLPLVQQKYSKILAFIVGLLFVAEAERIKIANIIESEHLFIVLLFLSISFFIKWIFEDKTKKNIVIAGVLLGLAMLTKPMAQIFVPIFLLSMAWQYFNERNNNLPGLWKKYFICALLFLITFSAVNMTWTVRNRLVYGSWKSSSLFPYAVWQSETIEWELGKLVKMGASKEERYLYNRNEEKRLAGKILADHAELVLKYKDAPQQLISGEFLSAPYIWTDVQTKIFKDPFGFAKFYFRQVVVFFIDDASSFVWSGVISPLIALPRMIFYPYVFWAGRLTWTLFYLIIFIGLIYDRRQFKQNIWILSFVILPIIFTAAISSFTHTTRYRLPINPFIFFLAVYYGFILFNANYKYFCHQLGERSLIVKKVWNILNLIKLKLKM